MATESSTDPAPINNGPKILKERELVNLFMACGILEHIAKDIIKSTQELKYVTDKNSEDFKQVVRESLNILEKEGVPNLSITVEGNEGTNTTKTVTAYRVCKVCSDTAAIKARYPERMGKWFRLNQGYKGRLRKEDWLCKGCYGEWYRDNKEWMMQLQTDKEILNNEQLKEDEQVEELETPVDVPKVPKKEYFIKVIVPLLVIVIKNLSPKAITHRKMLIRYIALGELRFNQLATALHYLRKLGSGVIDPDDFEKKCGIGRYADLFVYSSWNKKFTESEILHINEQEILARKEAKKKEREKEEREAQQLLQEQKEDEEKQKKLQQQLVDAENEALEKAKSEKLKKIMEQRKKEDEEVMEARKKADAAKIKTKEKREIDKRSKQLERERDQKAIENTYKNGIDELRKKKDERYRRLRFESQQRAAQSFEKVLLH